METYSGDCPETFDELAAEAIDAIRARKPQLAIELLQQAIKLAPNESEAARMLRDRGNAESQLGNYAAAVAFGEQAHAQHLEIYGKILEQTDWNNAETARDDELELSRIQRELGASAMMLAKIKLARLVSDETFDTPEEAQEISRLFEYGLGEVAEARNGITGLNGEIDQYEINFAGRAATAEALREGRFSQSLKLGIHALRLAFYSESPRLNETTNPNLSKKERYTTKKRAAARGLGSLAVAVVAPFNRGAAKNIARKII